MTDKIMDARRAKFEAWWRDDAQEELRKSCAQGWGEFIWNAALDSLCVELPQQWSDDGCGAFYKSEGGPHMDSKEVVAAIHAAGVKTK